MGLEFVFHKRNIWRFIVLLNLITWHFRQRTSVKHEKQKELKKMEQKEEN